MIISDADLEIHREPFARPFAFKGSSFHEKWVVVVRLRDDQGREVFGVGGLAVLWSEPDVFSAHSEVGGNLLQASLLEHALQLVQNRDFADPPAILHDLLPEVHDYAKTITGKANLRATFTLIALVALDNAAWMLYARQNGITTFDDLIPSRFGSVLPHRQSHIAIVPAVGYTLPQNELNTILDNHAYILKIKIGQPGDESEMVELDKARLSQIHEAARNYETPMTDTGHILYYLDANGRYGQKDSLSRLLDHTEKEGFLDRIILIEEPYQDPDTNDVLGLPARFAADESLHTTLDVITRIEQGYQAMTIKPAGKTLSLAFEMIEAAAKADVHSLVADNACVPILVEWNKNISARLPSFPGIRGGLMESNGPENYASWPDLLARFPVPNAPWLTPQDGAFHLDEEYYRQSGGIFENPIQYSELFR